MLHVATECGFLDVASLLIVHNVPLDVVSAAGLTAREAALMMGAEDIVAMIDFRLQELRGVIDL